MLGLSSQTDLPYVRYKDDNADLFEGIGDVAIVLTEWQHLAFRCIYTQGSKTSSTRFYINASFASPVLSGQFTVVDSSDNTHLIGAQILGVQEIVQDFYRGFMYSICVYNYAKSDFSDLINGPCTIECQVCPVDKCLSHCEWNEWIEEDLTCAPCESDCDLGCVRGTNCGLCDDLECDVCPSFNSGVDCTQCIDNANSITPQDCECIESMSYIEHLHECRTCDPFCAKCFDLDNLSCTECAVGYALQPDSFICKEGCPNGFVQNGEVCEGDQGQVYCLEFNDRSLNWAPNAFGGTSADSIDSADPVPIYLRGLWFDGVDDFLTLTDVIIHHTSTILLWIRPAAPGVLFSINSNNISQVGSEYFIILITSELALSNTYLNPDGATSPVVTETAEGIVALNDWQLVFHTNLWEKDDNQSTIAISRNNQTSATVSYDKPFLDSKEYNHYIGVEEVVPQANNLVKTGHYSGFIYEFCLYTTNEQLIPIGDPCGENECQFCPVGVCLIDCERDQFLEDGVCLDCDPSCAPNGCVRDENCNLCVLDPECVDCFDWLECQNETCIENATYADNDCTCDAGFVFDIFNIKCQECHPTCATCDGFGRLDCIECIDGYVKVLGATTLCVP